MVIVMSSTPQPDGMVLTRKQVTLEIMSHAECLEHKAYYERENWAFIEKLECVPMNGPQI